MTVFLSHLHLQVFASKKVTRTSFFSVAESQIGAYQDREGVKRSRLREQKEGSGGASGRSAERTAAGGLQGGGYLRAAASSPTSLLGEDYGE